MKFRKKPVVIDASRLTEEERVPTLEGVMTGRVGDWIIVGVAGERYPCRHDVFVRTYEPADEDAREYFERVVPGPRP